MKKHYNLIYFIVSLIIAPSLFSSCIDKDDFNFNKLSSIDVDGEWGIPIIHSTYSMMDLIRDSNPKNAWVLDPNGFIRFTYNFEDNQIIQGSDLLAFNNISASGNYNFPVPQPLPSTLQFTYEQDIYLENTFFQIDSGTVKSGNLMLNLTTNIDQPYTITLASPNLVSPSGAPFSATFSNTTSQVNLNLQAYKLKIAIPESDNKVTFNATINITPIHSTIITTYKVSSQIETDNLKFKYLAGKTAPYHMHLNSDEPFEVFNDNFTGNFTILAPMVKVCIENSFGVSSACLVDTFALHNKTTASLYPLLPQGTLFSCPASPAVGTFTTKNQDFTLADVTVNAQYNRIQFARDIIINPNGFAAGSLWIDESSTLNIKTTFEIPLESRVDSLYYMDTLDFKLNEFDYSDNVERVTFRLTLTNSLPFNVEAQVLFLDTIHHVIVDSLLASPQILRSAVIGPAPDYYVTSPTVMPPLFVHVEGQKLDNIFKANKAIICFKIRTPNNTTPIKLYSNQGIKAALGAKLKYSGNILN